MNNNNRWPLWPKRAPSRGRAGSAVNRGIAALAIIALLSSCAGQRAYKEGKLLIAEGKPDQGLAKLREAVQIEPENVEYRMALLSSREFLVNKLLLTADAALREGKLDEAEKGYRQVLTYEPEHRMAQQGLQVVASERRHRQVIAEAEALFKKGSDQAGNALEKLRMVLSENPDQKEALNLKSRIEEALAREQRPEAKLAATYGKPITLEFRDAPLKSVFDVISRVSGLNFFFDKDIRPDLKATILAKNTSVEDAVHLLLVTNQLEQKVLSEHAVLIYPNTPQKIKDYKTLSVRTFYLANADVKAVSNTIKTIVKTTDMVVDERLGLIILRDTPEAIRMAERIVNLQDLSDPEVMLEVEVMEVKRAKLLELGIQWPSQLTLSPLQSSGSPLTLEQLRHLNGSTVQASMSSMIFNARQEDQNGNVLANPRIRVRNKDKAKIMIGDRVPVITTTSTSTGFVSESVNYVDVGLKLEVEPNIYLDEEVAIKINLEVSSIVREVLSKTGSLSYQIGTRGANTVLRLKDGETQILAGLISHEERSTANKVPALGDLPLLGRLFGSQKDDNQRSEILLSITPHIVRAIRRPDLMAAEFEAGTETSIGSQPLRLNTVVSPQAEQAPNGANAPTAFPNAVPPVRPQMPPTSGAGVPSATPGMVTTPPALPGTAVPAAAPSVSNGAAVPAQTLPNTAPAAPSSTSAMPTPVPAPASGVLPASTPVPTPAPGASGNASAEAARMASAAQTGSVALSWQAPSQVKAGDQFTAALRVDSQGALRGLPMMVGFDPAVLQAVNVAEGEFFRQGNAPTVFNHRIDVAQGKIFAAAVRQGTSGGDPGVNGAGGVVLVTFKALQPNASTKIQLLSATPEPPTFKPVSVPVEHVVRVVP